MKKIVAICAALVFMLTSICLFSACKEEILTEEQHIQRITEKLQKKYFNDDGTLANEGKWVAPEGIVLESFEVEILLSFDGKPEYFLIVFEPLTIGVMPGIILSSREYRTFNWNILRAINPYQLNGIEKGNRYYSWPSCYPSKGFAAMIDGKLTHLYDGHIYEETEIEEMLQVLRSKDGLKSIRNYSDHL